MNLYFPRAFVSMSATWFLVRTYYNCITPHWTPSLIKWHLISMCFDRSWNTGFSESLIQLWLSQKILVAFIIFLNKLKSSVLSYIASHVAILATIYSASAELIATDFYFSLHQEIILDPTLKQYPEVLFQSTELPAQSVFNLTSSPRVYFNPYPTVQCTYLRMCLVVAQCTFFGSTMNWLRVLTTKQMSRLVLTRYMSDPMSCLSKVASTSLSPDVFIFF